MFDVLLISQNQRLITEIQKISAVTQCSLEICDKEISSQIRLANTVLIDAQLFEALLLDQPIQNEQLSVIKAHPNVVLITDEEPGPIIWQMAVSLKAKYVAFLPDAREWLLNNLIPTKLRTAKVIGVLGVSGGLGASVLATSIALKFANENKVVIAETQEFSGGLDVLWGIEEQNGPRWPALINSLGQVLPVDILRALPAVGTVSVIAMDSKSTARIENQIQVIHELATVVDYVILDLPNPADQRLSELIEYCDDLILIVGATIRSTNAANQLMNFLPKLRQAKLVVRELPGSALEPLSISKTLGVNLVGTIAADQKITEHLERGLSPTELSSGSYRKSIETIFANLNSAYGYAAA